MNQFGNLMKQAQQVQAKLVEAQNKIAAMEVDGASGGDMVRVKINGSGNLLNVVIDESLLVKDGGEILSDLLVAAFSDAKAKLDEKSKEEMSAFSSMLPAGMKLPL